MRILVIGLVVSCFGSMYAGTLPSDFHFRAPSNERVSFITQFKEYEEEKAQHACQGQEEFELIDPSAESCIIQNVHNEKISFLEKCKEWIAQAIAFLFMNK